MQVQTLLTPQKLTVVGNRLAVPLTIPPSDGTSFLVTLKPEELNEVDRQNMILKTGRHEILANIFRLGFNQCDALQKLQELTNGS